MMERGTAMPDLTTRAVSMEHEITVVILVLAVLAFAYLAWVDVRTWWSLRRQRDRTSLGPALKGKKLAWGVVSASLAVLYLLTLVDALDWYEVGIWPRLTVRLVTITAVVAAAITGRRFYRAYEAETRQRVASPAQRRDDPARTGGQ